MTAGCFRFDRFVLDPANRSLRNGGEQIKLNSRYFDALALLVCEAGKLVPKDRLLNEVWRGVPVTDEALTQCVRTLRRRLGDDATRPRFIETVPKHGYRFIAPVDAARTNADNPIAGETQRAWREAAALGLAGTAGGGFAGVIGGLIYGLAAASQPAGAGAGAASIFLVLFIATALLALMGGAGVSFALATVRQGSPWAIIAGVLGGFVVGAFVKLLGVDALNLVFGQTPGDVTGAPEGAILGGAAGLGAWLAARSSIDSLRIKSGIGALCGAGGGLLTVALGGRLMGGTLDLIARGFEGSRVNLDQIGALFGEAGFGPVAQLATATLEGALFAGCVVGAIAHAARPRGSFSQHSVRFPAVHDDG